MTILRATYDKLALALLICAAAHGAATSTTLTVTGTGTLDFTTESATVTGTATLTGIGNGTFNATVSLTSISGANVNVPFTITLPPGTSNTLTGTLVVPVALLTGSATSGSGSATITGGTGSFSGDTGSFPSLTGTGSLNTTTFAISFSFTGAGSITTGGGGTTTPTPTITQVADAANYSPSVAQGSIFIVKGTNLSPSGYIPLGYPLPTTSNGVTVTFTPAAGGSGTPAYLIYLYNQNGVNQIAAILPSSLATGNYNVTVAAGGATSAGFATSVVKQKIELFSQDSTGTGLAVVQNYISAAQLDIDRFTTGSISGITISPAKPGQVLIAWGTGMGPVSGGDNVASPGYNFAANGSNVQVIVGGVSITPVYAGRAPGLSGADQINFTLPANVPTGCTVPFQISVDGNLSAPTFISIAPSASAAACVSPTFTTAQLQNFDQGGTYTIGGFDLVQITETLPSIGTVKVDSISGGFTQYTGFQLAAVSPVLTSSAATGACQVIPLSGSRSSVVVGGSGTGLDAGVVTLNGPSGSNLTNQALTETSNAYFLNIGEEGLSTPIPGIPNGKLVAGTYTLAGAGGKDVGTFSTSLTLGSPLTITGGLPTVVNRSSNLTINWTGGNATDLVEIIGLAEIISGTATNATVTGAEFICTTTAGPGTFTVPSSILQQLPAVTAAAIAAGTSSGALEVFSTPVPTTAFSAPLTAGGTVPSSFLALIGTGATPAYQ